MKIQSKLPDVGTTIFTIMTNLANEYKAINLSQGFPDFDVSPDLISLVEKYMRKGVNQYAPTQGVIGLREKIAEKIKDCYNSKYDPASEITVTAGATEAIFAAITAVCHPGDEIIVFEPAYDSYIPAIELCGGVPICITMNYPFYSVDWDHVRNSISKKTRMIILNSPHNPTGSVLTDEDIIYLKKIIHDFDLLILSDEVYEHIIFDNLEHKSMSRYPELFERSFVISSFGKTYHTTGWKVGYCAAPQYLSNEFRKIHQYIAFAVNNPVQHAYAEFLNNKDNYLNLSSFYQKKRNLFLSCIQDSKFRAIQCSGTYFQTLDYSRISNESDIEYSKKLIRECGIASIPPSVFYSNGVDNKVLRFCFAKRDETIKKAAEKLCRI